MVEYHKYYNKDSVLDIVLFIIMRIKVKFMKRVTLESVEVQYRIKRYQQYKSDRTVKFVVLRRSGKR